MHSMHLKVRRAKTLADGTLFQRLRFENGIEFDVRPGIGRFNGRVDKLI